MRLASINRIYIDAAVFNNPRYRVFRYRNCFFTIPKTCSTFALTDDFSFSRRFCCPCFHPGPLAIVERRLLILYHIFFPLVLVVIASSRFSAQIYPLVSTDFFFLARHQLVGLDNITDVPCCRLYYLHSPYPLTEKLLCGKTERSKIDDR